MDGGGILDFDPAKREGNFGMERSLRPNEISKFPNSKSKILQGVYQIPCNIP